MKNLVLTLFAALLFYGNAWTQCPSQNITFNTQQEVDDFASLYPNCNILNGTLTIGEVSPLNDINDLTPLNQLKGIGGDLVIKSNYSLTTLTGLENLETMGGTLEIVDNSALEDLTGLNNLGLIGNSVLIEDNFILNTLAGLESLNFIGGSVTVSDNPALTTLSGLDSLIILGFSLTLEDNGVLSDLTALSNVTFLGGELNISNQPALIDLAGLESITNIGGDLAITATGLTSLSALENLTAIGGRLAIVFNDSLTELTGLDNIDYLTIVSLEILNNSNLAACGVESVCNYLSDDLPSLIANNALGCNYPNVVCSECPNGDVIFRTQQEVNEFALLYPNCNILNNNLTIGGQLSDISDLSPLIQLEGIGGDLLITSNPSLNVLFGLENISSIGGTVRIENNAILIDLVGLSGLNSIGNSLLMADNNTLTSLGGLENLIFIGGEIMIVDHTSLANLDGLDNLLILGNSLVLEDIEVLDDISALSNLTTLGGDLEISSTPALADLIGLENINAIPGILTISYTGVESLVPLQNLTSVAAIQIHSNNNLTELTGLENINPDNILFLELINNANLSVCDLENICAIIQTFPSEIEGNAPCCESAIAACSANECNTCLPGGIKFTTQAQIDNFPINYPGCKKVLGELEIEEDIENAITSLDGLSQLTAIGGNMLIENNNALSNLNGLSNLASVDGYVRMWNNDALTGLDGLISLTTIGRSLAIGTSDVLANIDGLVNLSSVGGLSIQSNPALTSLFGLENLTSIDGLVSISSNPLLTTLSGLDNVTYISGHLGIANNNNLMDLAGLENLTDIGDDLTIFNNPTLLNIEALGNLTHVGQGLVVTANDILTDLDGFANLTFVGEYLWVNDNAGLISLEGLAGVTSIGTNGGSIGGSLRISRNAILNELTGIDNIAYNTIEQVELYQNPNLDICNVKSICEYLAAGLPATIENNAPGCSSLDVGCSPCPTGDIIFRTQQEVDEFILLYPDCEELPGSLTIRETASDLIPLSQLTYIGGDLTLIDNPSLQTVFGLENITEIGGSLEVLSTGVNEFLGLNNLTSIDGSLSISDNDNLTSFIGLENLTAIAGGLYITDHTGLTDLTGLDNIAPNTILYLSLSDNANLSFCGLENICAYLSQGLPAEIQQNAPGCNESEICSSPTYCETEGTNTTYEYIQSVDINGFTNETGNDHGYGDYTHLPGVIVGGYDVPITLTPGFNGYAYDENWAIWIDINKDGDFKDEGEEVFSGTSHGTEPLTAIIHVPASSGLTRMRVVMRWKKDPRSCGDFKYGEAEDYIVDLGPLPLGKSTTESNLIQTYPNPASSYVNVDIHDIISNSNVQSVTAMIYTISGQQVHSQEMQPTSTLTINTQDLPEASYILRLRTDDGRTFTGKFVKL